MALLSELVATCEAQRVDTAATLNVFARRLREAGRVSKAGRGRGAAHMTFLDAARFLVACAATDHPERAVDAENFFSNLRLTGNNQQDPNFHLDDKQHETLDAALAKVLEELADGRLLDIARKEKEAQFPGVPVPPSFFVWLILHRGGSAYIRVQNSNYVFQHPLLAHTANTSDFSNLRDVNKIFEEETHRFRTGKNLSAELELPLLQAVADLIAGKSHK
ncbi:MAG: hypothetical protein LBE54_16725 [Brucellaceae bacterium]|jgi:hypothetical protein|nr:hypothetical protein [Brucellaceae bacterium]